MSENKKTEGKISQAIISRNELHITNEQDSLDLVWILSKKIKSEHEQELIKKSFLKLPFFSDMEKQIGTELMGRLFLKMKIDHFYPGDIILKENTSPNDMFIILNGKVHLKQQQQQQNGNNPYFDEMNTNIEQIVNRQDLYKKFIRTRKHQLEQNYQKLIQKRKQIIEEHVKRLKEKEEWEQKKIQWGFQVKHHNRRKLSFYSKRNPQEIDLNDPLIFENGDQVNENLIKMYSENSPKRNKKSKKKNQQDIQIQQIRNSHNGAYSFNKEIINLQKEEINQNDNIDNINNTETLIKCLEQGDYFGQNSLQEDKIQQYSAIAYTQVTTATISKNLFEEILFGYLEKNLQKEIDFLKGINLFSTLKQFELEYTHMKLTSLFLDKNAVIYKKGDSSDFIYIINDGEVEITYLENDEDGEQKEIWEQFEFKNELLHQHHTGFKKEYPVARLGKATIFGESEILKNTNRKSEVKVLSQRVHLYLLSKQNLNSLLEKSELKEELEYQRQQKSQERKKRIEYLKEVEKGIRKHQINYKQMIQSSSTATSTTIQQQQNYKISSQRQSQSNIMGGLLPQINTAREINHSLERVINHSNNNQNEKNQDIDEFIYQDEIYIKNQDLSNKKQPQKIITAQESFQNVFKKYGNIDFNDNKLYDFCKSKFNSVSGVFIPPSAKILPKIQLQSQQQLLQNNHYHEQKSHSHRAFLYPTDEQQQFNPNSENNNNNNNNVNKDIQNKKQSNSPSKNNHNNNDSIQNRQRSLQKQNRSYSLSNEYKQNNKKDNKIIMNNNNNIDYGYDLPQQEIIQNNYHAIHRNQQLYQSYDRNNNNYQNISNPILNQQLMIKKIQPKQILTTSPRKLQNKKSANLSLNNLYNATINQDELHEISQNQQNQQQYNQSSDEGYKIPISSSPPPVIGNDYDEGDDLSLQGDAYQYLKKVKNIQTQSLIPTSPPKIDSLKPKDKQIFTRKPMLHKSKIKKSLNIINDNSNNKKPEFYSRSLQYQESVMNMLNYERQKALDQINLENSISYQSFNQKFERYYPPKN